MELLYGCVENTGSILGPGGEGGGVGRGFLQKISWLEILSSLKLLSSLEAPLLFGEKLAQHASPEVTALHSLKTSCPNLEPDQPAVSETGSVEVALSGQTLTIKQTFCSE